VNSVPQGCYRLEAADIRPPDRHGLCRIWSQLPRTHARRRLRQPGEPANRARDLQNLTRPPGI